MIDLSTVRFDFVGRRALLLIALPTWYRNVKCHSETSEERAGGRNSPIGAPMIFPVKSTILVLCVCFCSFVIWVSMKNTDSLKRRSVLV